jgi:hypothetical protein
MFLAIPRVEQRTSYALLPCLLFGEVKESSIKGREAMYRECHGTRLTSRQRLFGDTSVPNSHVGMAHWIRYVLCIGHILKYDLCASAGLKQGFNILMVHS